MFVQNHIRILKNGFKNISVNVFTLKKHLCFQKIILFWGNFKKNQTMFTILETFMFKECLDFVKISKFDIFKINKFFNIFQEAIMKNPE